MVNHLNVYTGKSVFCFVKYSAVTTVCYTSIAVQLTCVIDIRGHLQFMNSAQIYH